MDPAVKRKIREAAEGEERVSYQHRMPAEWLEALAPLSTDWHKEFLNQKIDVVFANAGVAQLAPTLRLRSIWSGMHDDYEGIAMLARYLSRRGLMFKIERLNKQANPGSYTTISIRGDILRDGLRG